MKCPKFTICDRCLKLITEANLGNAVKVGILFFCCEECMNLYCRDLWIEEEPELLDKYDLWYDEDEDTEEEA